MTETKLNLPQAEIDKIQQIYTFKVLQFPPRIPTNTSSINF